MADKDPIKKNAERITAAAALARGSVQPMRSPGPIYSPRYDLVEKKDPAVPFGTSVRQPGSGKDAATGPGPGAYPLDNALKSLRPISLRGREVFGSIRVSSTAEVPGPGEYTRVDTKQTLRKNPPEYTLKSRRVPKAQQLFTPAPSAHQPIESVSKYQHLTKYPNQPSIKFGKPPRARSAVQIRKAAAVAPGPGEYAKAQEEFVLLSTVKAAPSFSMVPRREDLAVKKKQVMQPDFHKPMAGTGKQPLSSYKTLPSPSFSGRHKFGSPYFM